MNRSSIPDMDNVFSVLQRVQTGAAAQLFFSSVGNGGPFSQGRRGRGVNFHVSAVEVKKKCSYAFKHPDLSKACLLWDNVEEYAGARDATHDNLIRRMRVAC